MKRKKIGRSLLGVVALPIIGLALAACSNVQTFASQCAYVIQSGYFDQHHTRAILLPGQRYNGNNVTTRYVYCNARNYIVNERQGSDLQGVINAKTANDPQTGDGTPVDVQLTAYFTLNENHDAMLDFLPFCEKYNCFSPKDTTGNDTSERSSSQGWLNMIDENFPNAIHRAVQHAMLQFPPNIWNDTSKWPDVADAVQADFANQMAIATQQTTPFFCGQGSKPSKCDPVRFSIERIDPTDPTIRDIYNKQVEQEQQQQLAAQEAKTNAALLHAAEQKYGPNAGQYLGEMDVCSQAHTTCVINSGGGNVSVNSGG